MSDDLEITQRQLMFMSVPRSVRFRTSALLNYRVLAFLLIMTFMMFMMRGEVITTLSCYFGLDARAEVLKGTTWLGHSKSRTYTCYGLQISYPYPEDKFTIVARVTQELYNTAIPGSFINIRYLSGFENYPYVDMEDNFIVIFYALFLLVPTGIFLWQVCRDYDLLRTGTPVIGKIIGTREYSTRSGTVYKWKISYKLNELEIIKEFTGERHNTGRALLLLDPDDGKRAVIYNNKFYWQPVNTGAGL